MVKDIQHKLALGNEALRQATILLKQFGREHHGVGLVVQEVGLHHQPGVGVLNLISQSIAHVAVL